MLIHHSVDWQRADLWCTEAEDWDYQPDLDELIDPTPRKSLPFPEWHRQAACSGADEQTFFGTRDTDSRPAISMSDIARAKKICGSCPVYRTCLETALGLEGENREEYGIWAGTSGRTRKRIWALIDTGVLTGAAVVADILAGHLSTYEHDIRLAPMVGQVIPLRTQQSEQSEEHVA